MVRAFANVDAFYGWVAISVLLLWWVNGVECWWAALLYSRDMPVPLWALMGLGVGFGQVHHGLGRFHFMLFRWVRQVAGLIHQDYLFKGFGVACRRHLLGSCKILVSRLLAFFCFRSVACLGRRFGRVAETDCLGHPCWRSTLLRVLKCLVVLKFYRWNSGRLGIVRCSISSMGWLLALELDNFGFVNWKYFGSCCWHRIQGFNYNILI